MNVIPAVDVLDGAVVRLRRGDYDQVTAYGDDPVVMVSSFGRQGAALVHVVDLAAARSGSVSPGLWESVVATGIAVQAGGGVRDAETAARLVSLGVARVVVGTAAVHPDGPLEEIVSAVDRSRLVVGLDVRAGRVRGSGWTDEGRPLIEVVDRLVTAGAGRVLVTGIETDGTLHGPDRALLRKVRDLAPDLAIIASGGVGTLEDVRALATGDWEAVIVGRALYEGAFTLPAAIEVAASAGRRGRRRTGRSHDSP